jgi:sigma-B regulation protein RsbU (phosphoserine phosphatase)
MSERPDRIKDSPGLLEKLTLLTEAAHMLNSTIEYEELMKNVLRLVTRSLDAEGAMVYRYDPSRKDLKVRYYSGEEEPRHMIIKMGQGFVGWVAEHREPVLTNNPTEDNRYDAKIQDVELKSIICHPLTLRGEFFGVIEAFNKREGVFNRSDLDTFDLISDQIALVIHNAQLYRKAKRQALQRQTLFEVSQQLMMSLSLDEVLRNILTALQKVVDFNAGGIYLIDEESGDVDSITSVGYDGLPDADLHLKIGQGIVGSVARTGKPEVIPDTSRDKRYICARPETRSEIVVPVHSGDKLVGIFNLENDKLNAFSGEDKELLTAFALQAAISIERARLHKYMLEQKKIEEQLSIARTIQETFLPDEVPEIPGYDIWGTNIPSGEVGGDYYDFIKIVRNQLGISVADVSGKGIPAALIMASFRASLIAEIRNNYAIRTICHKVNNLLCESTEPANFVTAIYGVLDSKNSIFTFSNCGHNPAILLRPDDSVEELTEGGMLLGVRRDAIYEERPIYIGLDDILCLFTDGVTEAEDPKGEQFETGRIIEILKNNRDLPAARIGASIINTVKSFSGYSHMQDDLTLIIIRRLGKAT